jgi:hypothetical protein
MSGWGKADDKTSTGTVAIQPVSATFNGATNVASSVITLTAHGFRTGDKVNYVDGGGTQVVGIVDTTDYFITNVTTNSVQLALTEAKATQNVPDVITLADGSGASHKLTLALVAGTRAIATGASSANFSTEANVGDVITVLTQQFQILSVESTTKATVQSLDACTAITAFTAAQYTYSEKPTIGGFDSNTSAASIFGVNSGELVAGSDNVVSIAVANAGTNYQEAPTVALTAPAAITVAAAKVTIATNIIEIASHGLTTGDKLTYGDGSGTALAGLTDGTAYYVIKVTNDTIKVASSVSNAVAGTNVALSGQGNNAQTFTGDTATATAAVAGSVVSAITVTDVGSGYTGTVPTVTIEKPTITIPTSGVTIATESIAYTAHAVASGEKLRYQDGGGTALAGLVDNTVYFKSALGETADAFRLATTLALSAGTNITAPVISSTSGAFTCAAATAAVGDRVQISGTFAGTGSINSYATGTIYKVSAVTGTSPNVSGFTLTTEAGGALTTVVGTPTGITLLQATLVNLTGTGNNAQYFELDSETLATATASIGLGAGGGNSSAASHTGWIKRTVGTGARAGRVQYEVLCAMSKNGITGDAADDTEIPD